MLFVADLSFLAEGFSEFLITSATLAPGTLAHPWRAP